MFLPTKLLRAAALSLLAMTGQATHAQHISPDEALRAARKALHSSTTQVSKAKAVERDYALVHEAKTDGQTTVYVFSATDGQGFIMAPADSREVPVLGYSDESSFDPNNMPDGLRWFIEAYSEQIATLDGNSSGNAPQRATGTRQDVGPLCHTSWDQLDPYRAQTPLINGERCATGCLATALAQCMRVHRWPVSGTGDRTYEFKSGANTYSDSFNFGATTFDWDNMLDSYSGSYNSAQAVAVATLMHACGVASLMKYGGSLVGSNAAQAEGARGLVDYLGYDKGICELKRNWYSAEEWAQLLYDELAAGRPVPYSGQNGVIGHEFICDGYRASDGLFHINWGWSGNSNGYFALTNLNPSSHGTGGDASGGGYNASQAALFGMRAPGSNPSADYRCIVVANGFSTAETTYTRTSSKEIPLKGPFFNSSLVAIDNVTLGVRIQPQYGSATYVEVKHYPTMSAGVGGTYMKIIATNFPVGTCTVSPVYKVGNGAWQDMLCDRTKTAGYLTLNVTSNSISVITPDAPDAPIDKSMKVSLVSYTPNDGTDTDPRDGQTKPVFYGGKTYQFTFHFTAKYADSGQFGLVLMNELFRPKAQSWVTVNFTDADVATQPCERDITVNLAIPASLDNGYYYTIALTRDIGSGTQFISEGSVGEIIWREQSGGGTTDPEPETTLYTVTFNNCGMQTTWTQTEGNLSTTLGTATPNATGWTFQGWADAPVHPTTTAPEMRLAGSTLTPTSDMMLFAVYFNGKYYTTDTSYRPSGGTADAGLRFPFIARVGKTFRTPRISTKSAGALTYTSSNTGVATVDATGVVTPSAAGVTIITVHQEADGDYTEAEASYAVRCGTGTEGTARKNSETQKPSEAKKLKNSQTAYDVNTVMASVRANEPAADPEELREVTFDFANKNYGIPVGSSSAEYEADAHIISEGVVSLFFGARSNASIQINAGVTGLNLNAGTASWNISVPENYRITSIQYVCDNPGKVNDSNWQPLTNDTWTGEAVIVDFTQGWPTPVISTITVKYKRVGQVDPELEIEQPTYTVYIDDATFTLPSPVSLSDAAISYEAANAAIAEMVGNALTLNSVGETTITATQTDDDVYAAGTAECVLRIVPRTVSVSVGSAGWATYAPSYGVYMTETADAGCYYVTSLAANGKTVVMADLGDVIGTRDTEGACSMAEGTGILVKAPAGTTVQFPVSIDNDQESIEDNLLVGVTKDTNMNGVEGAYIFAQREGKLGFYVCTGGTLRANKCYLHLDTPSAAGAPQFILLLDDTATGIEALASETDDAPTYDLMGRRVAKGYRGVAIRRGMKCVIK